METMPSVSKSGMVIAGRGARACDMCAKERARWYCSADEAHLCERCDRTVHTANLVAKRHERVRLGPNGTPMKIGRKRNKPSGGHRDRTLVSENCDPSSKTRTASANSRGSFEAGELHNLADTSTPLTGEECILVDTKLECVVEEQASVNLPHHRTLNVVKSEPSTPTNDRRLVNTIATDPFDFTSEESELADEVPTYEPFLRELIAASHGDLIDEVLPPSHSPRSNTAAHGRDEEAGAGRREYSLDSSIEPASEVVAGLVEDGSISINELPEIDEFDVMDLCATSKLDGESIDEGQDLPGVEMWRSVFDCTGTEAAACSLFGGNPFKGKGERQLEALQLQSARVKIEVAEDAIPVEETDRNTEHGKQLLSHEGRPALGTTLLLRLDYEEVLSAWSDRGSLWMDGQRPQIVPDDCFLDSGSMDVWLHQESSCNSSHAGERAYQVPVLDRRGDEGRAREARVMRYREKRQTRLFSKKIRYEVRKLNADRRPRVKGRFVKRSTIMGE